MKVLLTAINAKYIHANLAIYSLRAFAAKYADQIGLAEFTINQYSDEILEEIYKKKPDILAFSCYIWNIGLVEELVENLHLVLPSCKIWLGGPEVSYESRAFLRDHPQICGIMKGEGERTFLQLMEYYLERKGKLDQIPGILWNKRAYREETACMEQEGFGETVRASGELDERARDSRWLAGTKKGEPGEIRESSVPLPQLLSMDELPFVYQDMEDFSHRIIYYESSRGCPFFCSYCLSSIDRRVRLRSLSLVYQELQRFLDAKVPQVKFVDRTFNCSRSHAMGIWQYLLEHDNGITNFHFEIEAELLDEDELALLSRMRPGLVKLEIGVQSTNEKTLAAVHRSTKFETLAWAVGELSKTHNIHLHLDLIAGLPLEDYESFGRSFDQVYGLRPQELQLGFLKVLKGAGMYQDAERYGIVYRKRPVYEVLFTPWLSYDEILRLKGVEEMLEVYYNSGQFVCTIRALEQRFASPFHLFEALAAFYQEQERMGSLSRLQRLELLRSFAYQADPDRKRRYDQELLMDLYLRENAKTRPAWAPELGVYKEKITRFYQREEQERVYLPEYKGFTGKQMAKMTHLEPFFLRDGETKERWILFDYQQRDPLTNNARIIEIS